MFKYVALLAILSVTSQTVLGQNEIYDNVADFANYIFNGLLEAYHLKQGIISIPDHRKLSNGFFSNLTHIKPLNDVWIHAKPANLNPRPVTIKFKLDGATVFYNNYRFSLLAKRTLQYNIDLKFAMDLEIEVNNVCTVMLKNVKVTSKSDTYNENVTGGIISPGAIQGIVRMVAARNSDVAVEAARANIEERVKFILGDGSFNCASYGPTGMFYPSAPVTAAPAPVK